MTKLEAGVRLRSVVSTTELIVTMGSEGTLTCGGQPMIAAADGDSGPAPTQSVEDGVLTLLGKRYHAPGGTLQVLCVRQGAGALELDGCRLEMLKPKVVPASD